MEKHEQIFQDRVDELLVLEKRAEQRAQAIVACGEALRQQVSEATSRVNNNIHNVEQVANDFNYRVETKLEKLQKTTESAINDTKELILYNKKAITTFVVLAAASLLVIFGTTWRFKYLCGQIDDAKDELEGLQVQLNCKPEIVKYGSRYYVRIKKYSDVEFTKGGEPQKKEFGSFAEIWRDAK